SVVLTLSGTNILCNGASTGVTTAIVTGGTAPYTYNWSGGQTTSSVSSLSAGTYSITILDNGGCTATAGITLTQPTAIGITISSVTNVACSGNTGKIVANSATGGVSPYTYSWSPSGGTNLTATGLSAGTYTLTAKDHNGCSVTVSATV